MWQVCFSFHHLQTTGKSLFTTLWLLFSCCHILFTYLSIAFLTYIPTNLNFLFAFQFAATIFSVEINDPVNSQWASQRLDSISAEVKQRVEEAEAKDHHGCQYTRSGHDHCLLCICAGDRDLGIEKVSETKQWQQGTAGEFVLGQPKCWPLSWSVHHGRSVLFLSLSHCNRAV